jgi:hypothetical protein
LLPTTSIADESALSADNAVLNAVPMTFSCAS